MLKSSKLGIVYRYFTDNIRDELDENKINIKHKLFWLSSNNYNINGDVKYKI